MFINDLCGYSSLIRCSSIRFNGSPFHLMLSLAKLLSNRAPINLRGIFVVR